MSPHEHPPDVRHEATARKPRVIFVASLTPIPDGGHGGQLQAATTLAGSELARRVEFLPVSSSMDSIPPPPLPVRTRAGVQRMASFARLLPGADALLVFAAGGLSVIEKGAMCVAARLAGRGVVVRFSSGDLPDQCREHPTFEAWLRVVLQSAHVIVSQGPRWTRFFGAYPEAEGKLVEIPNSVTLGAESVPVPGRARVLFVGWMDRDKGIFELLEAADTVRQAVPHARFDFIGGGRDLEAFRAAVARRGLERWVKAYGWLPHAETRPEYAKADVFALPTHFEGLPNALLEAMASALPVVVTPVGAIPDVIRDGDNGVFVPVREPAALASALERLLTDPDRARAIGARARSTVAEGHDHEHAWRKYAGALARACREAGREARIEGA